jgi:formiminotetrahydrofolate cyclodeaminase
MGEEQKERDAARRVPLTDQAITWIAEQIADPELPVGGGAMAGITLAGAAASAELVVRFAARRKANAPHRDEIEEILCEIQSLRPRFLTGADQDLDALTSLLTAQRAVKQAGIPAEREEARERLHQATVHAAAIPIELASSALTLLRLIDRALPFATRFTISDLGVAAGLANGAIAAALLTSDINIALLAGSPIAEELREAVTTLRIEGPPLAEVIVERVRGRITGDTE